MSNRTQNCETWKPQSRSRHPPDGRRSGLRSLEYTQALLISCAGHTSRSVENMRCYRPELNLPPHPHFSCAFGVFGRMAPHAGPPRRTSHPQADIVTVCDGEDPTASHSPRRFYICVVDEHHAFPFPNSRWSNPGPRLYRLLYRRSSYIRTAFHH